MLCLLCGRSRFLWIELWKRFHFERLPRFRNHPLLLTSPRVPHFGIFPTHIRQCPHERRGPSRRRLAGHRFPGIEYPRKGVPRYAGGCAPRHRPSGLCAQSDGRQSGIQPFPHRCSHRPDDLQPGLCRNDRGADANAGRRRISIVARSKWLQQTGGSSACGYVPGPPRRRLGADRLFAAQSAAPETATRERARRADLGPTRPGAHHADRYGRRVFECRRRTRRRAPSD
ncbi:hypothetical protein D3C86_1566230 [compost metagenome]